MDLGFQDKVGLSPARPLPAGRLTTMRTALMITSLDLRDRSGTAPHRIKNDHENDRRGEMSSG
jgi:hypothetical protein